MKLTNKEILEAIEPLKSLLEEKFPIKTSYALAKLAVKLDNELKAFNDVRTGLIKKYGVIGKEGQLVVEKDSESWTEFEANFTELLNQEIEVVFEKVVLADINIEPSHVMVLDKFIEVK